jgi:hypothetical protein
VSGPAGCKRRLAHALTPAAVCTVFIKSEFFIQMESLKWHLLPVANAKRGAFIYLFGQPPK